MFRAQYLKLFHGRKVDEYWRTITNAYDINEATNLANRYAKGGYICSKVISS